MEPSNATILHQIANSSVLENITETHSETIIIDHMWLVLMKKRCLMKNNDDTPSSTVMMCPSEISSRFTDKSMSIDMILLNGSLVDACEERRKVASLKATSIIDLIRVLIVQCYQSTTTYHIRPTQASYQPTTALSSTVITIIISNLIRGVNISNVNMSTKD